jgi:hypothetical protein
MRTDQQEISADGKRERRGDESGLQAAIPRADHNGDTEQGKTAFGDVSQQNRGNQGQGRTEYGNPVAQDGRTGGWYAE